MGWLQGAIMYVVGPKSQHCAVNLISTVGHSDVVDFSHTMLEDLVAIMRHRRGNLACLP